MGKQSTRIALRWSCLEENSARVLMCAIPATFAIVATLSICLLGQGQQTCAMRRRRGAYLAGLLTE
jgi:hypothetical protein